MKYNTVGWFEIPVTDMDRAKKFYQEVFGFEIKIMNFQGTIMGWFPSEGNVYGASGCLVKDKSYEPGQQGTLVYFTSQNVATELNKVSDAGGQLIQDKTQISDEHGYMGIFIDTEGNRLGIHSKN